ncbi:MAG: capsule assembly Wzi family protein [Isosphaeraceae bacterium]
MSLQPAAAFQQNRSFAVATEGPATFGYPYHQLDWPQRFGEDAYWSMDFGESVAAVAAGPAEVAVGTEHLWWGPARRYPLLLSNTGPGFPHVALGLTRPVEIGIGSLRLQLLWGRLDGSTVFSEPGQGKRLLTGVFAEYRPSFARGLTLGLAGLQHNLWAGGSGLLLDLFTFPFQEKEHTAGNGLLSVTASWTLPESHAEIYAEFGRDDYWASMEDLLGEPGHSAAYTLGIEKVLDASATPVRLSAELTHLEGSPNRRVRGLSRRVTWYEHFRVRAGHTERGQLLGAWVGPGSDAQYLALDLLPGRRMVGFYAERVRHDEDAYQDLFAERFGTRGHDVEWTLGLQGTEPAGSLVLRWEAGFGRRMNRAFIELAGEDAVAGHGETNALLTVTAFWFPGR